MRKTLLSIGLAASTLLLPGLKSAYAVAELQITDGVNTVTIVDNGANDSSSTAGLLVYNPVGGFDGWLVSVNVGTTQPLIGSPAFPHMDLSATELSSNVGHLTILFSDTGFGPTAGTMMSQFGSSSASTVGASVFVDAGNTLFAKTTTVIDNQALNTVAYGDVNLTGPYSITLQTDIDASTAGQFSSLDLNVSVPDNGTTLLLLGTSLTALALFAGVRKQSGAI